jgi:hypothetical protein
VQAFARMSISGSTVISPEQWIAPAILAAG